MRTMTLREIQNVSLDVLKEIDAFCQKNGIGYSLGYGGLIGAVRHKGCIPWDDDIDIVMTRPDYLRFVNLYKSDTHLYKLYAPELGNCYYTIARLCEMKATRVKKYYQWTDEDTGVWIDIFPIDDISSREVVLRKLNARCYAACRCQKLFSLEQNWKYNVRNLSYFLKYGILDRRACINSFLDEIVKCHYDEAKMVGSISSPYVGKDKFDSSVFDSYIRVPFENMEVSIIESYDKYLKTIYGNYMSPPPLKKQKPKHTANKFYWTFDEIG